MPRMQTSSRFATRHNQDAHDTKKADQQKKSAGSAKQQDEVRRAYAWLGRLRETFGDTWNPQD